MAVTLPVPVRSSVVRPSTRKTGWRVAPADRGSTLALDAEPAIVSAHLQFWIELVPHPVAHKIEREHRGRDGDARKQRNPPGGCQHAATVLHDHAPRWMRRRNAEPKKAQGCFEHDC